MRVLVTTNAAVGHFLPMAATLRELVAAGHDVRIGCPESFVPFVRRVGFLALGCAERDVSISVPPMPPADDWDGRLTWAVTLSWPSDCRPWVDSLLQQAREWRPDVVMVEPVEHAGRIVAAALGVPLVVHGWGFTLPAYVEDAAASGLLDLYERVSARPTAPALVADLGPPTVQARDAGPATRFGYRPFSVPGQPLPPPRTGRPRVLATLGTYPNPRAAALMRTVVTAAVELGTEVVAILGNDDRGAPTAFPPGTTALQWVDMPAAVASCDLVVHHGGAGTSWATLTAGKPAVVLPQGGDQYRNAEVLCTAGAALTCTSDAVDDLTAAIEGGLAGRDLAERATSIARQNAALPTVAELARHITAAGVPTQRPRR